MRDGMPFFFAGYGHFDSIAQSAVYLNDDLNLVLDEQPFIVGWPGLFSDVAARIAEFCI